MFYSFICEVHVQIIDFLLINVLGSSNNFVEGHYALWYDTVLVTGWFHNEAKKKKKSFSTKSTKLNTFSLVTKKTNLNIEDAYLNRVVKYTETKQDD